MPITMLMTEMIIVIVLAHDLPDHKPHVMMKPNAASMRPTSPIPIRIAVVKAIIGTPVNTPAIC